MAKTSRASPHRPESYSTVPTLDRSSVEFSPPAVCARYHARLRSNRGDAASARPCARSSRAAVAISAPAIGRYSERPFNALRYGLRPGETPDVEITSAVPGQGNHPAHPKYLAPPMPWPAYRHLADDEIRAIASYLRNGVRPVSNRVPDSEGPQDFWGTEYTPDMIGMLPVQGGA